MEKCFKGGNFFNRYKILGTLTALSPLHIGDGEMAINPDRMPRENDEDKKKKKDNDVPKFSTVMTDVNDRAYIPGSTLKGNLRSWLTQILSDFQLAHINDSGRAENLLKILEDHKGEEKGKLYKKLHENLMMAEYLFGSNANEGKLEFWDAPMKQPPVIEDRHVLAYSGYDSIRGTILQRSVAINPKTGTAAKNKLYNYEVVPQGAGFELTVAGQNLCDEELGMLLFALEGFNSFIYPVTLGAMGGVGLGRFRFEIGDVRYLDKTNFQAWISHAVQNGHAGYSHLPELSKPDQEKRIREFKQRFLAKIR